MSETERGDLMVARADGRYRRAGVYAWVGRAALTGLILALIAIQVYGYAMGKEREREINALQDQATQSDTAAVEVAEERQAQARSVRELCESGAIELDAAGQAVCDEASRAAEEDPAVTVAQAKGDRGPEGPRGPAGVAGPRGPAGADGTDGTDGPAGTDGATGPEGADGAPGVDGAPGEAGDTGPAGATGDTGPRGETGETGPQGSPGPQGDPGPVGPSGDPGPAGPAGEDGTDGRGIASATCDPATGRWTITYTDDTTEDGGPCLVTPESPDPTPTPTEEVTP